MNAVQAAELKAKLSAILRDRAGIPISVREIAAIADIPPRSAGQLLAHMANNDLIPQPEREKGQWMYVWGEKVKEPEADPPPKKRVYRRAAQEGVMDDDLLAILGAVALFKRGILDGEGLINGIKAIVRGR